MPETLRRFERVLLEDFRQKIDEWSRCSRELTRWEDAELLDDPPDPARLAQHKAMLERLTFFGQVFAFVTSRPDFPDGHLAELVHATQWVFREKFRMFHNPMPKEEAERLLAEVFPES